MREQGPYEFGLQTRTDTAEEALALLRLEIKKYVEEGPTEKELQAAIRNITGGFPLRIASNSSIVGYVGMIGFYGLPLDYLDTFNKSVSAVTVKDIKDAFQRRVNPDKMVTVLVGKGSGKATAKETKLESKKPS
jgi:zinc protease